MYGALIVLLNQEICSYFARNIRVAKFNYNNTQCYAYLNFQQKEVVTAASTSTTEECHFEELMKKLFRASMFSAMMYSICGPMTSATAFFFNVWLPAYVLRIGSYLSVPMYLSSTVNFVSYTIFIKDFRLAVLNLFNFKRLVTSSQTAVVSINLKPINSRQEVHHRDT